MIPIISLEHIVNYCGKKSYDRGRDYLDTDALYMCYQDSRTLRAFCEGIVVPSYKISISFDALGITNSRCSCKASRLGPCKHIAAVLLTWYYKPTKFYDNKSIGYSLQLKKKKELIKIIEKMLEACKGEFVAVAVS